MVVRSIVEVAPLLCGTDLGYRGEWRIREDAGLFTAIAASILFGGNGIPPSYLSDFTGRPGVAGLTREPVSALYGVGETLITSDITVMLFTLVGALAAAGPTPPTTTVGRSDGDGGDGDGGDGEGGDGTKRAARMLGVMETDDMLHAVRVCYVAHVVQLALGGAWGGEGQAQGGKPKEETSTKESKEGAEASEAREDSEGAAFGRLRSYVLGRMSSDVSDDCIEGKNGGDGGVAGDGAGGGAHSPMEGQIFTGDDINGGKAVEVDIGRLQQALRPFLNTAVVLVWSLLGERRFSELCCRQQHRQRRRAEQAGKSGDGGSYFDAASCLFELPSLVDIAREDTGVAEGGEGGEGREYMDKDFMDEVDEVEEVEPPMGEWSSLVAQWVSALRASTDRLRRGDTRSHTSKVGPSRLPGSAAAAGEGSGGEGDERTAEEFTQQHRRACIGETTTVSVDPTTGMKSTLRPMNILELINHYDPSNPNGWTDDATYRGGMQDALVLSIAGHPNRHTETLEAGGRGAAAALAWCPPWGLPTRPGLILRDLPRSYTTLYSALNAVQCPCCDTAPSQSTAVCLICGTLLCGGINCCKRDGVGECTRHARVCGAGIGLVFLVHQRRMLLICGPKAAYYPSPYVDAHFEVGC